MCNGINGGINMKVEEFMIGDWVYTDGELSNVLSPSTENCEIETMDEKGYIRKYDEIEAKDYIEPIPITKDILEKNGFKKRKYESMFCNNEQTEYINKDKTIIINGFSNTTGKDWNCHIDNDDMETIGCADIQYVHELQHLLRLCNIDKEIEL